MTGLNVRPITSRVADRCWEMNSAELQSMTEEDVATYVAILFAPLRLTALEFLAVVDAIKQHQRDNARPPDDPPATDDPLDRLFQ